MLLQEANNIENSCPGVPLRRTGILQKAGFIRYKRGAVRVLNRKNLENAACECYQTIKQFETESEREA